MEQTNNTDTLASLPSLWSWFDILLITLSSVLVIVLGSWLLAVVFQPQINIQAGMPLSYTAGLTALEAIGLFLGVRIFGLWRKKLSWADVGMKPASSSWLVWAGLTAVVFIPIIGLIALAIQLALGLPLENPQLEFLAPPDFSWIGALAMVTFGGFIVPVAEELFFRGVLYRWMRQSLSMWPSIFISSLIFGLLHGNVAVAGATFVMGIILAWFYERSGSLWAPITIHIINNASKLVLLYVMLASGIEFPTIV
jgi:membrane protease YdiL (CAAX protease family)